MSAEGENPLGAFSFAGKVDRVPPLRDRAMLNQLGFADII
jgi:hypothetical protein